MSETTNEESRAVRRREWIAHARTLEPVDINEDTVAAIHFDRDERLRVTAGY
jgi:hypothetical protein